MQKIIIVLGLLIILLCSGASFALSLAADDAIMAVAEYAQRPDSVSDIVERSYEYRSIQPGGGRELAGAGMLALFLLVVAAILAFMWRGQLLTREVRLIFKKRPQRPFPSSLPYLPPLPTQTPENVPTLPRPPQVPRLPAWIETDYEDS